MVEWMLGNKTVNDDDDDDDESVVFHTCWWWRSNSVALVDIVIRIDKERDRETDREKDGLAETRMNQSK